MEFSEKLKKVREILEISQETLARELGVSFATINRLEMGRSLPSYKTVRKLELFCKNQNIIIGGAND